MQSSNNPPLPPPNPTISIQERAGFIESIKKFLIENLPADQISSPQRAQELAIRFESHVAHSTQTKEQYHSLITEKLRMIKGKMDVNANFAVSNNNNSNIGNMMSSTTPSTSNAAMNANNNPTHPPFLPNINSITPLLLSPHEISQMSARLLQLRNQIPQIDKLISMHSRESIKKLIDCRNVLVNQIDLGLQKNVFFINFVQLNVLVEQIQKHSNFLIAKLKEASMNSSTVNTGVTGSNMSHLSVNNNNTGSNVNNFNPQPPSQQQINTIFNTNSSTKSTTTPSNTPTHSLATSSTSSSSSSSPSLQSVSSTSSSSFKFAPTNSASNSSTNLSFKSASSSVSSSLTASKQTQTNTADSKTKLDLYEKQLRVTLSTSDVPQINTPENGGDQEYYCRYLNGKNSLRTLNKKRLMKRDLLLKAELKGLTDQGYRIHFEENDQGYYSVLITKLNMNDINGAHNHCSNGGSDYQNNHNDHFKYFFQIPPMYPFEQLLYRIEDEEKVISTLPSQFEPKTSPYTLSCILKNHSLFLKLQQHNYLP